MVLAIRTKLKWSEAHADRVLNATLGTIKDWIIDNILTLPLDSGAKLVIPNFGTWIISCKKHSKRNQRKILEGRANPAPFTVRAQWYIAEEIDAAIVSRNNALRATHGPSRPSRWREWSPPPPKQGKQTKQKQAVTGNRDSGHERIAEKLQPQCAPLLDPISLALAQQSIEEDRMPDATPVATGDPANALQANDIAPDTDKGAECLHSGHRPTGQDNS